jgi:hypothetical protein
MAVDYRAITTVVQERPVRLQAPLDNYTRQPHTLP